MNCSSPRFVKASGDKGKNDLHGGWPANSENACYVTEKTLEVSCKFMAWTHCATAKSYQPTESVARNDDVISCQSADRIKIKVSVRGGRRD